jgi:hypothetical protein
MDAVEFCIGETKPDVLEKILLQHKNNSVVAVVDTKSRHLSVHGAYTSYENSGDALLFYHGNPDGSRNEILRVKKGEICCIGPSDKVNLKMDECRKAWLSQP